MIYSLTIGLSAFLLFLVQPLISKMLLPHFGGGASIWITSLVFFQLSLLIGYGLTHVLVRRIGIRRHMLVMVSLLFLSMFYLPVSPAMPSSGDNPPAFQLFLVLASSVGVPYLLLATTSPALQYWIANDTRTVHHSPYVQYGVSNLGSLAGLLIYPFVVERYLTNSGQSWLWTGFYLGYTTLLATAIVLYLMYNRRPVLPGITNRIELTHNLRLRWIFLAMVPSALLVVITHFLTVDLANLPLLWVIPLSLYLLTFIICFLFPVISVPGNLRTLVGVGSILLLLIAAGGYYEFSFGFKIIAALSCLFCVCMIFHGDLERSKPHKEDLTDFYLQLAAGGSLGGILAAVIAPIMFDSTFEFYVVIIVAVYYIIVSRFSMQKLTVWLFRGATMTSFAMSYVMQETGFTGKTLYQTRTFYSTYAVRTSADPYTTRSLVAGTHVHGRQFSEEPLEHLPIAYYHEGTGVPDLFETENPSRIAVVGLGIGTVVEFGDENDTFDLFELDPAVIDIANRFFSVLPESDSTLHYHVGDARIKMRERPANIYDLIVMDVFTSGSIPVHLATLEAIEELLQHLKSDGVIAYHISNQHVDLLPVLNAIAHELDLAILYHESAGDPSMHKFPAVWVSLAPDPSALEPLAEDFSHWKAPPDDKILWRDEFSNLWSVIR
ncbi:MAG: fused MFS/spermidine synthase [Pseudomonadales bacterium]